VYNQNVITMVALTLNSTLPFFLIYFQSIKILLPHHPLSNLRHGTFLFYKKQWFFIKLQYSLPIQQVLYSELKFKGACGFLQSHIKLQWAVWCNSMHYTKLLFLFLAYLAF